MKSVVGRDIFEFKFLSGLMQSPDSSKFGFVVQQANEDGDGYKGYIHLYDQETGKVRQLTGQGDEKSLVWLDNTTIMFPSMRDKKLGERVKKGELWTVYYTLDITGGEAREYMRIPMKIGDITPVGGERFVVSASYIPGYPNMAAVSDAERAKALKRLSEEKNYEVFEEIPFWSNGVGVTSGRRNRLYLHNKATGDTTAISGEREQLLSYCVNENQVVFITTLHENVISQTCGLYIYDLDTGERRTLIPQESYKIHAADYVGDKLVVAASEMKTHGNSEVPNLYLWSDGGLALICENDRMLTNVVASDVKLGKYRPYRKDNRYMYFIVTKGYYSYIARMGTDGNMELFGSDKGAFFDALPADGGFVAIGQRSDRLQELYFVSEDGSEKRLTGFNEGYYKEHSIVTPRHFTYTRDGAELDGWVMLPPGCDCGEMSKYPAILNIHGGPKTAYGSVFMHEMQVWANEGYVVLYTNPRGSAGKGDAFADIRGKYGTLDYEDIMCFVDEVLWRYRCIDPDRLGVTGGSYGGFMTNWIVGHTDRFKAAATQRSISNWVSFFGTTDIGYFFAQDQIAANPWDSADKLWWHSPLKYAKNFKTPMLVIHSDQDLRCWWVEGLQMFTALKYHGVESRMWVCHGENHELSRGGKPKNRLCRLKEISCWFEKFLKK